MICVTQVYQGHTLEKTYQGEDFFWAITPTAGDYVLFKFDRPVSIERYVFVCQLNSLVHYLDSGNYMYIYIYTYGCVH